MKVFHRSIRNAEDAESARRELVRLTLALPMTETTRARLIAQAAAHLRSLARSGGELSVRLDGDPPTLDISEVERQPSELLDDELLAPLLETIERQREELRWHQTELAQTNAGLLALHAELEEQRQQVSFLDAVTRTTSASLDRAEVLDAFAEVLRDRGFAARSAVWLPTPQGGGLHCPTRPGESPAEDVRQVFVGRSSRRRGDHQLLVPLVAGPQVLGVLELGRDHEPFSDDEVALAQRVAERAAVGLRNVREYERERELAETLQQAMLPPRLVRPDLEMCARYLPASRGVHVGGDWFDAFTRTDGRVVLTVGDVTGHGVDAAVVMGKLQNTLRAYAMEGHGPADALRLVHELLRRWDTPLFATAVTVEIDPAAQVLRWASAGHLPVLLREPDGQVRALQGAHAPLLGVPMDIPAFEHQVDLAPATTLLLYTDGLVERRSSDIDSGVRRLAEAFCQALGQDAETTAQRLLDAMLGAGSHEDDVCLLLCHWIGERDQ
ncbi:PP2C family protein-serine/threonine phosphatase [Goodfellowiella coeruleoviolacea]|uniref:GAF domain-containing protein n=1 Tax=Goodfellowiella coeruleoviolacea TaxID=334858 RepID=A0AAE3GI11_9PSEU|nr:SpoIIE family protein phosphatase [Goodfellowiella coeruleoviolacea]MCP2166513.1 GAF domain-containing protein [Goodfellowiella coeruleoviolacea]